MSQITEILFRPLPRSVAALALLVVFAIAHLLLPSRLYLPNDGTIDFVQYWAAARIIEQGGDPYDPAQMLEVERTVGFTQQRPIMYWSPPWFISIAKPILALDFPVAAATWMRVSVALYLLTIWLGTLVSQRGPNAIGIIVPLLFAPLFDCLRWGQSSTALAFGVGIALFSLASIKRVFGRNNASLLFGTVIPWLSLKPHLFLVIGAATLFAIKKWKVSVLFSLIGAAVSILVITQLSLSLPKATINGWGKSLLVAESTIEDRVIDARQNWITPTVAGITRLGILEFSSDTKTSTPPLWPSLLIPALGIVIAYRLLSGDTSSLTMAAALLVSALFAPYGWHYDLVILAAPLSAILCETRRLLDGWPIILAVIVGKITMPMITAQHQFIGEALLLLLALLFMIMLDRSERGRIPS